MTRCLQGMWIVPRRAVQIKEAVKLNCTLLFKLDINITVNESNG